MITSIIDMGFNMPLTLSRPLTSPNTTTVRTAETASPTETAADTPLAAPLAQAGRAPVLAQNLAMLASLRRPGTAGGVGDPEDAKWEPPRSGSASGL
jgi:hypothetical protein